MRFPFALTKKIASHIIKHKLRKTPKFAMVLQLEPLHTCNLTCTGCGRIREYSTSLKDMVPLEKCLQAADGVRRADGFHLRRRTADLSEDRGIDQRPARTGPRHLRLHERHVHAEKNEGLSRGDLFACGRAEVEKIARPKIDFRKRRRDDSQIRRRGEEKSRHSPDAMDVLERPRGRFGIYARFDCRARRRISWNASKPSRWRKFSAIKLPRTRRFTRKPTWRKSRTCSSSFRRSKWTATRFRPATITTRRKRTWSSALARIRNNFS